MDKDRSNQFSQTVIDIIDSATERFNQGEQVELKNKIPLTDSIPFESNTWWKIEDVVCVYIDMKNSTQLSAQKQDKFTAGIYQYFTGTAVKILNEFGASYIDVRGDGAFGLFDSGKIYHGFASAVSFKTIVNSIIANNVKLPDELEKISCHIGMDKKTVLVKRIGIKVVDGKTDKSNEVWAGKPVNMAAKLASLGETNDIIVSDRISNKFFIDKSNYVLKTCGCGNKGQKTPAWEEISVNSNKNFDFDKAYKLTTSGWCLIHGKHYCESILRLDQ